MPVPPVSTFPSVLPRVEHRAELAERRTRKRTISATCGPRSQWGAPYLGRSHSKSAQELCTSNHPVPNSHVSPYQSRRQTLSLLDAPKGPFISTAPKSRYNPRQNNPIRRKVYFYHKYDPHYSFTNFSPHPVMYEGKIYPTSEHLFQSFKFQDHKPGLAEHIRTCSERPSVAFSEARRFQPEVRPDWKDVNIEKMNITLSLKFRQHPDLQRELLDTGDAELIEDSDKDAFWGIGADRQGRNELGKALERLRAELRRPTRVP
ncbi:DUF1768-domain-containing protein [Dendrothele bispora CBS 962.96]|uniref:DUF1768-domain-containing protein n=1 Tax=Dendrothele bispora (strain CBS 962.96) TaxID=1314807 RepID=A0A4S8MF58_DENBC|nr:DUF1768-domain-containing protein [Dendrothele bispora CBS 962.96]